MGVSQLDLEKILHIGREVSLHGAGISLQSALVGARYKNLRPDFAATDLVSTINANPAIVQDWLLYSQDKRTSGGWYLLESGTVGQVASQVREQFSSIQVAVAQYVVRELDFWAGIAG
jgi:hypothetical protein